MPRSRGSEMPQKQSPRAPQLHLKPAADANGTHRLRPEDRRSPRSSPLHEVQKKRGTRVSDLETKLGHAQEELKKLREQLASAEAARRDAQRELEEAKKLIPAAKLASEDVQQDEEDVEEQCEPKPELRPNLVEENPIPDSLATDVFEIVICNDALLSEPVPEQDKKEDEGKKDKVVETPENFVVLELKEKLVEKEKQLESLIAENLILKKEAAAMADSKAKGEEMTLELRRVKSELQESNAEAERLNERLEATEEAKSAVEMEMRKLQVQTSQWRKAAETATAALTEGEEAEANGRRVAERRGYETFGSPIASEEEEGFGGGKRRGSGIRVFGDLWKKKAQQK